jgi:hypothetical protein
LISGSGSAAGRTYLCGMHDRRLRLGGVVADDVTSEPFVE